MASANPSPDDYIGFYIDPPTEEQFEELRAVREHALDYPLERGDSLSWQGPNLHPESLPPADYPCVPSVWSLRLLEGLQTGAGQWSQVWRCEAVDQYGAENGRVLLKLYDPSLFPFPDDMIQSSIEDDSFVWWPARHAEACESRAYCELSAYQGRDVPICYGFYMFHLPDGKGVVGVVLEDLVFKIVPFSKLAVRPTAAQRGTYEQACAAFELHRRVNECGILHAASHDGELHQLKGSWRCIVAIGFGHCEFLDRAREIHRRSLERTRAQGPVDPYDEIFWALESSQAIVKSTVTGLIWAMRLDYERWRAEEKTQERLSFLDDGIL
ncbi:hypothetical protein JCM9279_005538 [Rhodotorula babjevae]